jgi:hypothetical protein
MVKIDFEVETTHGKFADALYFEANAVPDDATIEALKQERVDNWIAVITAPPAPDYVEIDGVLYEKIQLDGQVVLKPVGV